MKWNNQSRRMFLQGAGKFTLSIPFLPSLMPRELWAATTPPVLRYIGINTELGYAHHADWFPTMNRPSTLGNMNGEKSFYYQALRSFAPNTDSNFSPIFKSHLNKYLNHINIYKGLDMITRFAHGPAPAFGNLADNTKINSYLDDLTDLRTIDQVLNDSRKFNPAGLDSVLGGLYRQTPSFKKDASGKVVKNTLSGSPTQVFNNLLGNVKPKTPSSPTTPTPPTDPMVDVLGRVYQDYSDTRKSRNLSASDKIALDSMTDRLSDLQRRLRGTTGEGSLAECSQSRIDDIDPCPGKDSSGKPKNDCPMPPLRTMDDYNNLFRSYVDVVVMAMVCDTTRVAMIPNGLGGNRYDFMSSWAGASNAGFHEGVSHKPFEKSSTRGTNQQALIEYNEIAIKHILVPLMEQMSAYTDPTNGKSMLYNSLIHVTQESALNHSYFCHPVLLAGHAGGAVKTGYLIDYMDRSMSPMRSFDGSWSMNPGDKNFINCWPGLIHNRLFATILQGLGLSSGDYKHSVKSDALGTTDGYGYINAKTYDAKYIPHSKSFNDERQRLYELELAGRPLPGPSSDAA